MSDTISTSSSSSSSNNNSLDGNNVGRGGAVIGGGGQQQQQQGGGVGTQGQAGVATISLMPQWAQMQTRTNSSGGPLPAGAGMISKSTSPSAAASTTAPNKFSANATMKSQQGLEESGQMSNQTLGTPMRYQDLGGNSGGSRQGSSSSSAGGKQQQQQKFGAEKGSKAAASFPSKPLDFSSSNWGSSSNAPQSSSPSEKFSAPHKNITRYTKDQLLSYNRPSSLPKLLSQEIPEGIISVESLVPALSESIDLESGYREWQEASRPLLREKRQHTKPLAEPEPQIQSDSSNNNNNNNNGGGAPGLIDPSSDLSHPIASMSGMVASGTAPIAVAPFQTQAKRGGASSSSTNWRVRPSPQQTGSEENQLGPSSPPGSDHGQWDRGTASAQITEEPPAASKYVLPPTGGMGLSSIANAAAKFNEEMRMHREAIQLQQQQLRQNTVEGDSNVPSGLQGLMSDSGDDLLDAPLEEGLDMPPEELVVPESECIDYSPDDVDAVQDLDLPKSSPPASSVFPSIPLSSSTNQMQSQQAPMHHLQGLPPPSSLAQQQQQQQQASQQYHHSPQLSAAPSLQHNLLPTTMLPPLQHILPSPTGASTRMPQPTMQISQPQTPLQNQNVMKIGQQPTPLPVHQMQHIQQQQQQQQLAPRQQPQIIQQSPQQQQRPPVMMMQAPEWFYQDPHGNIQGPFLSKDMRNWWEQGYFKPHLLIREATQRTFLPLSSVFPDMNVAFLTPTQQQQQQQQPSLISPPPVPPPPPSLQQFRSLALEEEQRAALEIARQQQQRQQQQERQQQELQKQQQDEQIQAMLLRQKQQQHQQQLLLQQQQQRALEEEAIRARQQQEQQQIQQQQLQAQQQSEKVAWGGVAQVVPRAKHLTEIQAEEEAVSQKIPKERGSDQAQAKISGPAKQASVPEEGKKKRSQQQMIPLVPLVPVEPVKQQPSAWGTSPSNLGAVNTSLAGLGTGVNSPRQTLKEIQEQEEKNKQLQMQMQGARPVSMAERVAASAGVSILRSSGMETLPSLQHHDQSSIGQSGSQGWAARVSASQQQQQQQQYQPPRTIMAPPLERGTPKQQPQPLPALQPKPQPPPVVEQQQQPKSTTSTSHHGHSHVADSSPSSSMPSDLRKWCESEAKSLNLGMDLSDFLVLIEHCYEVNENLEVRELMQSNLGTSVAADRFITEFLRHKEVSTEFSKVKSLEKKGGSTGKKRR